MLDKTGRRDVESAAMQMAQFSIRPLVVLALAFTGVAWTQPAPTKTPNQALVALHAIDKCEASLEEQLSHAGKDDYQEAVNRSPYKTQLQQAQDAINKVTDADLQRDLNILLTDVQYGISNAAIDIIVDKSTKSLEKEKATFRSDRDLIATEINTGKRGLLRDAVLKRSKHKS